MQYRTQYHSPLGLITLTADGHSLTGLWMNTQPHAVLDDYIENSDLPIFQNTRSWLDIYFQGQNPQFQLPLRFTGTDFQNEVWQILADIPYGQTTTYGTIAKTLAERRDIKQMSAQAVGGAVGHNKISIIVPCHRVLGTGDKLTGYTGGLDKKIALLKLEKILPAE